MATAGSAVGLGSLWKFPYVTGENGGGLFVLAYLVFTFLIGVPIFMGELVIGRLALACPVGAFSELSFRSWRFLGWLAALATLFVFSFYSVVAGWALNYSLMSLLDYSAGKTSEEIRGVFDLLFTAAEINLLWTLLFIGLTAGVVYKGIRKGIEFWSKILMPLLFLSLIFLFIYSTTLEGFIHALKFIFAPRADQLTIEGLLEALGLACFTLSVGMGVIITYGSYMKKNENIPKTALIIALVNLFVSLIAALVIFPIIFTFNFPSAEGPGLLFKTLPVVFAKLPGTLIISTAFFLLVVFAALTSTISIMEVMVTTTTEVYGWSRGKATIIIAGLSFLLAIPSALSGSQTLFANWVILFGKNFFGTIDSFTFVWLLPINVLCTALFVGWWMQSNQRKKSFLEGCDWNYLYRPWIFLMRFVIPLAVIIIILQGGGIIDMGRFFR